MDLKTIVYQPTLDALYTTFLHIKLSEYRIGIKFVLLLL